MPHCFLWERAFYFYMPFEAYYTAKKRMLGTRKVVLETPIDRLQQQFGTMKDRELWGGIALIVIGALYFSATSTFSICTGLCGCGQRGWSALGVWFSRSTRKGRHRCWGRSC